MSNTEHVGRHRIDDDAEMVDRVADAALREMRHPHTPRHNGEASA